MMPKTRPPHLHREFTRHGKAVWYVRRARGPRIRLSAEYDSPDFWTQYRAALEGVTPERNTPKAKTLEWGLDRYRHSSAWAGLDNSTRRARENIFRHVIASAGSFPLASIDSTAIVEGRERRLAKPHAANNFLKAMRGFFRWAADPLGGKLVPVDPTKGVKLLAGPNDKNGWHTWTEDEVERYEQRWPVGTRERLALDLMLYTGLSRGDVVRLGRQHVRDGVISIRTEKEREDGMLVLPMLPVLAQTVAQSPTGDLTYIVGERGRPMTKESFGNWFGDVCRTTGVSGRAHGLRKAGATRAAENGASEPQLMAIFDWSTPKMAAHYTRKARKKKLAADSVSKLLPAHKQNENGPHLRSGAGRKAITHDGSGG